MKEKIQNDCFAYDPTKNKCRALKNLECKDCKFYKSKNSEKFNRIFKETMHST